MGFLNKIRNISLESINKNLLLLAIASLIFRSSSFAVSHIPNPFEIIFSFVIVLTLIDFIKNKKIKEFFILIPKKSFITIVILSFSILLGWIISCVFGNTELNKNIISEFGTFVISISLFFLVLFYSKKDGSYTKKYLYALLIPVVYIIFVMFPHLAAITGMSRDGLFYGFSNNVNIISKILLIPTMFFIVKALFEINSKLLKMLYIVLSSILFILLLWVNQRGAILSLFVGIIFVYIIFSLIEKKKMISNFFIIIIILIFGFMFSSNYSSNFVLGRIVDTAKISYSDVSAIKNQKYFSEPRLEIWPFYLKYSLSHPLGVGPNTHTEAHIIYNGGIYENPGPHNTYLQFLLWGGFLGFLGFFSFLYSMFSGLKSKLIFNNDPIFISLFGISISLMFSIIFNDSISVYCFWVVLALLLRYKYDSTN